MTTPKLLAAFVLVSLIAGIAQAVEPAYTGHLGNPEEPAMRPYKWMVRGLAALVYQTGKAFKDGNEKYPIVGSVYTFRGLRKGIVELERSQWRGLCGANDRTAPYKETGKANAYIEDDFLLRNVADGLTASYAAGLITSSAAVRPEAVSMARESLYVSGPAGQIAAATFVGQKALDRSKPVPEWGKEKEAPTTVVSATKQAQTRYIGERANTSNKVAQGKGNFLKLAK